MLESALVAGICSAGAEAVVACTLPTSAIAYLTRHSGYDAGVVISASHNTVEYNGIKFFNSSGYKLADEIEDRIEDIIMNGSETIPQPTGKKIGRRVRLKKAAQDYMDFVVETTDVRLDGMKVVLDCANGAAKRSRSVDLCCSARRSSPTTTCRTVRISMRTAGPPIRPVVQAGVRAWRGRGARL